jgi:hypothetical protein
MDFKQIKAIEQANKKRLKSIFGDIPDSSGIYILTRKENGFKYAYIGQAKHILTRLAEHLRGFQHIDLSIKKHGFISSENPNGWDINFIRCELSELDKREQYFIKQYANGGWQLRNKTAGGQGEGKIEIAETRPRKTYREGLAQGYANAQREIKKLFEKNLRYEINGNSNKNKEKSFEKFKNFLGENND